MDQDTRTEYTFTDIERATILEYRSEIVRVKEHAEKEIFKLQERINGALQMILRMQKLVDGEWGLKDDMTGLQKRKQEGKDNG